MDRQNPRTNGKSKAIPTKSHTEAYTYTLTKREKGKKNMYIIAPKVHLLNFGWFIVSSGILQMQVHQVDCGDLILCSWGCWEGFPFLFFVRTAPGDKPLGLVSAGQHRSSLWESLRFALHTPVAALSSVAPKLPPSNTRSLCPRRGFLVCGNLSSFTAPSLVQVPSLFFCLCFFFFLLC